MSELREVVFIECSSLNLERSKECGVLFQT